MRKGRCSLVENNRNKQRHAAVTSLCASRDKTAQKPDTRNPPNVLYPRAETWLSHGSWYCIYRLSDHTANMKNVEQMEGDVQRVSSDSSSGRKRDNVKQVDVSARGRTSLAADKSIQQVTPSLRRLILTHIPVFVVTENRRDKCAQLVYVFSSSLAITAD